MDASLDYRPCLQHRLRMADSLHLHRERCWYVMVGIAHVYHRKHCQTCKLIPFRQPCGRSNRGFPQPRQRTLQRGTAHYRWYAHTHALRHARRAPASATRHQRRTDNTTQCSTLATRHVRAAATRQAIAPPATPGDSIIPASSAGHGKDPALVFPDMETTVGSGHLTTWDGLFFVAEFYF